MSQNGVHLCLLCASYINLQTSVTKVERYRGAENAYVDHIKILGSETGTGPLNNVCLVLRIVVSVCLLPLVDQCFRVSLHEYRNFLSVKLNTECSVCILRRLEHL